MWYNRAIEIPYWSKIEQLRQFSRRNSWQRGFIGWLEERGILAKELDLVWSLYGQTQRFASNSEMRHTQGSGTQFFNQSHFQSVDCALDT